MMEIDKIRLRQLKKTLPTVYKQYLKMNYFL